MTATVELSHHAQEKEIPDFEIQNILEKDQGKLFYDTMRDSLIRSKGRTVVVFEKRDGVNFAITAYRKASSHKFSNDRFEEIS